MLAARDDFTVLLDGDAFSRQVERLDQLGDGKRSGEGTGFAVDDQFNHNFYPAGLFSRIANSTLKVIGTRRAQAQRGRRIVALPELPKLMRRVRFPSPAPDMACRRLIGLT